MEWAVGNRDAAVKLLETWMGEYPEDHLVLLQLASRYYTLGEKNKATTTYLKVLKLSPENVLALNDVAWLLRETEPVQAVLYAEKAFSIEPDSTDVIDTLAMVLSKSNSDRARKLIGKAVRKSPDNPTIRYHQAIILRDAGINDEAFIVVQSLLEKYRQFPEREEASQLLKDLEGS